jgi:NAD(P)-dependent dehydrogenase (short-subunit alcohol dehydrogenase family)
MDLTNRAALITGGTKGIGAATAMEFARRGADVALVGRNDDAEAREVAAAVAKLGRRAEIIVADMGQAADCARCVDEAAKRLDRLDVLVHSAGELVKGGLFEVSPEAWQACFDVHVHAVFHLTRAAVPHLRKQDSGAIVLVSSTAGLRALQSHLAYQVAKGALPQFTRALARELGADNIRVNCVAPGVIRTRLHADLPEAQRRINIEQRIPLRREGQPIDIATMIVELATNDFLTGQTVTVDGGLTMRIA